MLKSKSASCLASPTCPRALARSPRSPPIATSFTVITPSAVTEIVSPSGLTEPCVIGGIGGSRGAGCGVHLTHTGAAAETEASPLPYSRLPSRSVHWPWPRSRKLSPPWRRLTLLPPWLCEPTSAIWRVLFKDIGFYCSIWWI